MSRAIAYTALSFTAALFGPSLVVYGFAKFVTGLFGLGEWGDATRHIFTFVSGLATLVVVVAVFIALFDGDPVWDRWKKGRPAK